jgi:WD40 repeat protein
MSSTVLNNGSEERTRVFISYSRKESSFAEKLRDELRTEGFDAYLDKHDIMPGEPWHERITDLISSADAVIYCLSPASVASQIVDWEINEAERLAKRNLPIIVEDPAEHDVPHRLKRLNYIFMRNEREWSAGFTKLIGALNDDIDWVREHTRLGVRALEWNAMGRTSARLLRGKDIAAAESWLARCQQYSQATTALQLAYIAESRRTDSRRSRILIVISLAVALVAACLSGVAVWQRQVALANLNEALVNQSRNLTALSLQQTGRGDAATALLLALEALPSPGENNRPYLAEAEGALHSAEEVLLETVVVHHQGRMFSPHLSPNGDVLITGSSIDDETDHFAYVFDTLTGRLKGKLAGHSESVAGVAFSPNGRYVISRGDHTARVWDVETLKQIAVVSAPNKFFTSMFISSDYVHIWLGGDDGSVSIWKWRDQGAQLKSVGMLSAAVGRLGETWDGNFITAISDAGRLKIFDSSTLKATIADETLLSISDQEFVATDVAFEHGSDRLVVCTNEIVFLKPSARVIATTTGQLEQEIKLIISNATEQAPQDTSLLTCGFVQGKPIAVIATNDGGIRLSDGTRLQMPPGSNQIISAELAEDELDQVLIAVTVECKILVWRRDGTSAANWADMPRVLVGHLNDFPNCPEIASLQTNVGLLLTTGSSLEDASMRLWRFDRTIYTKTPEGNVSRIEAVAISSDSSSIAISWHDGGTSIHRANGLKRDHAIEGGCLKTASLRFSPDGQHLALACTEGGIVEFNVISGQANWVSVKDFQSPFVAWSDTSDSIAYLTSDREVVVQRLGSDNRKFDFSYSQSVKGANIVNDGKWLAVNDGSLDFRQITDGHDIAHFVIENFGEIKPVDAFTISQDGKYAAASDGVGNISVWEVEGKRFIGKIDSPEDQLQTKQIEFGGDGTRIAVLWDSEFVSGFTYEVRLLPDLVLASRHIDTASPRLTTISANMSNIGLVFGDNSVGILALSQSSDASINWARNLAPRCLTQKQRSDFFLTETVPSWCFERQLWPYVVPEQGQGD